MRHPCRMAGGKRPSELERCPRMDECPCSQGWREGTRRKRIKAEFGYDDRKGVGPCDRGPSGLGEDDEIGMVLETRPVSRAAEKAN